MYRISQPNLYILYSTRVQIKGNRISAHATLNRLISISTNSKTALYCLTARHLSERKGFRGPGHLVSSADWMPGTARTPVSLSLHSYEGRIL